MVVTVGYQLTKYSDNSDLSWEEYPLTMVKLWPKVAQASIPARLSGLIMDSGIHV
jgi:hypothetical protein